MEDGAVGCLLKENVKLRKFGECSCGTFKFGHNQVNNMWNHAFKSCRKSKGLLRLYGCKQTQVEIHPHWQRYGPGYTGCNYHKTSHAMTRLHT